jgi:hypothetical protein
MLMEEQIKETMKETITWSACLHGEQEGGGTHASFLGNQEEMNSCRVCSHGNQEGVPPSGVAWPQYSYCQ